MRARELAILAPLLLVACGDAGTPDGREGGADSLVAVETDSLAAGTVGAFDPDPLPMLPGEGDPRDYRLQLVNRLDQDAYVFASAGAARVVLDTVPAADSVLIDIRLRADRVSLEAENPAGEVVDSTAIDLQMTQINRWEITAPDRGRVTLLGSDGVLVTPEAEDYPRSQ